MTQNLSAKLSALLTNLNVILEAANTAEKTYAVATGNLEGYSPFTLENAGAVQNNSVVLKAVINASLAIAAMRGDTTEGRLQALQDLASWSLTEVEALVARLYANATWWARNISRDLQRATRPVCADFAELPPEEVNKDDVLLKAVAAFLLSKLG